MMGKTQANQNSGTVLTEGNAMSAQLIQALLLQLPRFAEEEGVFYPAPRSALLNELCQYVEPDAAETALSLLENLLDTLAVLDRTSLQNGEWRFVSYPAQLLASSILTAMSDADSRLFAANFWNTHSIGNERKDSQREVLRWLETARTEHHAEQNAQPIRFIYVAWSLIKLDGRILFYQREDTQKRHDKTAGDYGLPGGRANQNDIGGAADPAQMLAVLQAPNSELVLNALPTTLQRELREEAGLRFDEHYQFSLWRRLQPYRQVQGAAPNHALTEYYLDVYQIELTLEGFLYLQQRVAEDERLVWLTPDDIERGTSDDGKIPYIQALYRDFGGDRAALAAALQQLPDSFNAGYRLLQGNPVFIFPIQPGQPIRAGEPGKDKPLPVTLSRQQLQTLLGLAAHARGFDFKSLQPGIALHAYGWIELTAPGPLQAALPELAAALAGSPLQLECRQDRLFRLPIQPASLYFADALFSFVANPDDLRATTSKIPVSIRRAGLDTAFGQVAPKSEAFSLPLQLVHDLLDLSKNRYPADNETAVKIEDRYKKGLHLDPRFKALGLRNLVRREAGVFKFALPFRTESAD